MTREVQQQAVILPRILQELEDILPHLGPRQILADRYVLGLE